MAGTKWIDVIKPLGATLTIYAGATSGVLADDSGNSAITWNSSEVILGKAASAPSLTLTGGSAGNGKLWYGSSAIQFGNNIGNVTDAGAWAFPKNTEHLFGSTGGGNANTVLGLDTASTSYSSIIRLSQGGAGEAYIGSVYAGHLLSDSSATDLCITANGGSIRLGQVSGASQAVCSSAGAWTFPVSVYVGGTSAGNYSLISTGKDTPYNIAFGRNTSAVGWGVLGADSTYTFRVFAGGTSASPSAGTEVANCTQAGEWTWGPVGSNAHIVNGQLKCRYNTSADAGIVINGLETGSTSRIYAWGADSSTFGILEFYAAKAGNSGAFKAGGYDGSGAWKFGTSTAGLAMLGNLQSTATVAANGTFVIAPPSGYSAGLYILRDDTDGKGACFFWSSNTGCTIIADGDSIPLTTSDPGAGGNKLYLSSNGTSATITNRFGVSHGLRVTYIGF